MTPQKIPGPPTPRHLLGKVRLERACDDLPHDPEKDSLDTDWHEPIVWWETMRRDLNARGSVAESGGWGKAWVMIRCNNPDCSGHAWVQLEDIEDMMTTMVAKAKNVG